MRGLLRILPKQIGFLHGGPPAGAMFCETLPIGTGSLSKSAHLADRLKEQANLRLLLTYDAHWRTVWPSCLEHARPMMRRRAGFDTNQARRQLLEEGQHISALEPAAKDDIALRLKDVGLKKPTSRYPDRLS